MWKAVTVLFLACMIFCTVAKSDQITFGFGSDYEFSMARVLYGPDPNSQIGAMFLMDSDVESDHLVVGPVAEFKIGKITKFAMETALPTGWADWLSDAPFEPFARIGFGAETETGGLMGLAGTGTRFFPDWYVSPSICTLYVNSSNKAGLQEGFRTLFELSGVWRW